MGGQRGPGEPESVPALAAPPPQRRLSVRDNRAGLVGLITLGVLVAACFGSLPWTLGAFADGPAPHKASDPSRGRLPPAWAPIDETDTERLIGAIGAERLAEIAAELDTDPAALAAARDGPLFDRLRAEWPSPVLGTDSLGRSLLARSLLGGTISLFIGISAAGLSVLIGTVYGAVAGYAGGAIDGAMMRVVDVLYGLPYILLVVLLAVAGDALVERVTTRGDAREAWVREAAAVSMEAAGLELEGGRSERRSAIDAFRREPAGPHRAGLVAMAGGVAALDGPAEVFVEAQIGGGASVGDVLSELALAEIPARNWPGFRTWFDLIVLLVAIGGVSWLTMARVIRGQVLSLKNQPFVEAARALGASPVRVFAQHLLPNLVGPVVVYATLTVPQAILQESFLSFLGIGVDELPSWGNLAADGLSEVNRHKSHWWLLVFPSVLLGVTLLSLNFVGEALREAVDPKRGRR